MLLGRYVLPVPLPYPTPARTYLASAPLSLSFSLSLSLSLSLSRSLLSRTPTTSIVATLFRSPDHPTALRDASIRPRYTARHSVMYRHAISGAR